MKSPKTREIFRLCRFKMSKNKNYRKVRECLRVRDVTGAQLGGESWCAIVKNVKFKQKVLRLKYLRMIVGSVCFSFWCLLEQLKSWWAKRGMNFSVDG